MTRSGAEVAIVFLQLSNRLVCKSRLAGVENIRRLDTPCVFVANHMSTLETIVLPSIIRPVCPVTFVVKQSLLDYPLFRHIAGARDPIAVSRDDPRADLKAVMEGGIEADKAWNLDRRISANHAKRHIRSVTLQHDRREARPESEGARDTGRPRHGRLAKWKVDQRYRANRSHKNGSNCFRPAHRDSRSWCPATSASHRLYRRQAEPMASRHLNLDQDHTTW